MSVKARLKEGNLLLEGELDERLPAVTDGLVSHYPFDGVTEGISFKRNLVETSDWIVGRKGTQGKFALNGTSAENDVIIFTNPWGYEEPVWASLQNDAVSDADGGWNVTNLPIDRTKKYRLSVWMRRENIGNGTIYFGCQASTVCNLGTTTVNGNPYFVAANYTEMRDKWVLFVAYIHPHDYTGSHDSSNGMYYQNGSRIRGISDFKWTPTATVSGHRSYLYYSTAINERQYWVRPRFEVCDGTESSIPDLLAGRDEVAYPSLNTNTTSTYQGVAIEEATTNLWSGGFNIYNNFGVPASLTKLNETYLGQPIYRLAMTVTDAFASYLTDFRTSLFSHGVHGGTLSWVQDTKYVSSIYWRPVNKPDTVFGGVASNTGGWSIGPTEYLEDGWRRYSRYRTGVGIATKSDVVHHSFCCPSLQLNETIYIDVCCPQTEKDRVSPTSYTTTSRLGGELRIPTNIGRSDFTICGELNPNDNSNDIASGSYFLTLGKGMLLRTYLAVPYIDGNTITGAPNNNVHFAFNTMPNVKCYYIVKRTGNTFSWRMISEDGKDVLWEKTHANVSTFNISSLDFYRSWGGRHRNLSIYNRSLSNVEISELIKKSFSPSKNGNLNTFRLNEKAIGIPSDALHIPLDFNSRDRLGLVSPNSEANTTYGKGAVWVGTTTTNYAQYEILTYTSYYTYSRIGNNHLFYRQSGSTSPTLAMQCPTFTSKVTAGQVYTISGYLYLNGKPYQLNLPHISTYHTGTTNKQSSSDGFFSYTQPYVSAAWIIHSNLVNANIGDTIEIRNLQIELKGHYSAFVDSTIGPSDLEFNLHRDYQLDWSKNWTISYWKKPVGTEANNLTGYSIESLGSNSNSVGGGYMWFGKSSGANFLSMSPNNSPVFIPSNYFDKWQLVSIARSGNTITYTNRSQELGVFESSVVHSYTAANRFVTQYGYDLKLGGWDNTASCNTWFKDLVVAKRALSKAELDAVFNTQMSAPPSGLQVQGQIYEGQTLI